MSTITPTDVARQIAGTYIEDETVPGSPLAAWIQAECRAGCFRDVLVEAFASQEEPLRVELALVVKVEPDRIVVRVPCRLVDHENRSPFESDAFFALNPLTQQVERISVHD